MRNIFRDRIAEARLEEREETEERAIKAHRISQETGEDFEEVLERLRKEEMQPA